MKGGLPPTARKARTGLFTPPGITRCARAKSSAERSILIGSREATTDAGRAPPPSRGSRETSVPAGSPRRERLDEERVVVLRARPLLERDAIVEQLGHEAADVKRRDG